MLSYDFFLAHAGPDSSVAERLYEQLSAETRVFLDSRSLLPGDDWSLELPRAQRLSRVTVVLVSAGVDTAFYQREEIAAAIQLAREAGTGHRVVPVYLEPPSDNVPYGLRLKHGLVVSERCSLSEVADRLLDLHRRLDAGPHIAPAPPAVSAPPPARSRAELVGDLFHRDPVVSVSAAARLSGTGPMVVADVIAHFARVAGRSEIGTVVAFAVRTLLSRFPEQSAPLMVERVLDAHRAWHVAAPLTQCFSARHRSFGAGTLARHLHDWEPDVVRLSIESLGYMADETWAHSIVDLLESSDDYRFGKFASYAVAACARMLVFQETSHQFMESWSLPVAFSDVERLLSAVSETSRGRGIVHDSLRPVLAKCQPRHTDYLITSWLVSDDETRRALAAWSLGQMRLHRSLPRLTDLVRDPDESETVVSEAAYALANIAGADAVTVLNELLSAVGDDDRRAGTVRAALVRCVQDAPDDDRFARCVAGLLARPPQEVCFVYRAIGVRRDDRFADELHRGLNSTEWQVRGQCALALARVEGAGAQIVLRRAYAQAGAAQERALSALALLSLDQEPPGDPELRQLRTDLASDSPQYLRLVTDDILQTLSASRHPRAAAIAQAWTDVYAEGVDY